MKRNSFDTGFSFFRGFAITIVILIVALFLFRGALVYNAVVGGKLVYQITVNSYNGPEEYITNEFTKDEKTGCITFKDELGIKRIVCNQYTITQF